jgi:hypothetical protein
MRDPLLNGEANPYRSMRNGVNGNTLPEPDHDAFDTKRTLNNRPKSAAGLHGTYDELYRLQNCTSETSVDSENQFGPQLRNSRPRTLQRVRSDFGPRNRSERVNKIAEEDLLHMRHGWHDEYTSNEYLSLLNSVCTLIYLYDGYLMYYRLSICTIPIKDTIPVEYPNQVQKHGPTRTGE